ncbi:MAG: hypothetical protein CUN53_00140 [Phototrophicales bacterium]|nr:MAG: hypothetical protein CUN53_00140 [Phototrophicales bacterium]
MIPGVVQFDSIGFTPGFPSLSDSPCNPLVLPGDSQPGACQSVRASAVGRGLSGCGCASTSCGCGMGDTPAPVGGRLPEVFSLAALIDFAKSNAVPLALVAGGLLLLGGRRGRR